MLIDDLDAVFERIQRIADGERGRELESEPGGSGTVRIGLIESEVDQGGRLVGRIGDDVKRERAAGLSRNRSPRRAVVGL